MTTITQSLPFTLIGTGNGPYTSAGNVQVSTVTTGSAPSFATPVSPVVVTLSGGGDIATLSHMSQASLGTFDVQIQDTGNSVQSNILTYTSVAASVGGTGAVAMMILRIANP